MSANANKKGGIKSKNPMARQKKRAASALGVGKALRANPKMKSRAALRRRGPWDDLTNGINSIAGAFPFPIPGSGSGRRKASRSIAKNGRPTRFREPLMSIPGHPLRNLKDHPNGADYDPGAWNFLHPDGTPQPQREYPNGVGWPPTGSSSVYDTPQISDASTLTSAPVTLGVSLPRSFFGMSGNTQQLTDMDPGQSLRCVGRDLFSSKIASGSAYPQAGFGGSGVYYASVSPASIAPRLANIEEIFMYYAIRYLKVYYAPASSTTSTCQIALGYEGEVTEMKSAFPNPTQAQTLELESASLFPVWMPGMIEMSHTGTKLWLGHSSGTETVDEEIQGLLCCTLLNGVLNTTWGQLWCEYVVDFYKPMPASADPSLVTKRVFGVDVACAGQTTLDPYAFVRDVDPSRPRRLRKVAPALPSPPVESKDPIGSPPLIRTTTPRARRIVQIQDDEVPLRRECDDDWTTPSPPAFTAAPSSVPGTPAYKTTTKIPSKK
jgi:hypothetical protein